MKRLALLDAAAQQAAWWWAVLLAAGGRAALAAALPVAVVAVHLALRKEARVTVLSATLGAALYGLATDALLVALGLLAFPAGGAPPAFMVALWGVFGAGLTASLRALARWPPAAVSLAAAVAGPLAYRAGAALDALAMPGGKAAMAAIGAQWALGLPLLVALTRRAAAPPVRPCPDAGES